MRQGRVWWAWTSGQIYIFLGWKISEINRAWCRCIQREIITSSKCTWWVIKTDWYFLVWWDNTTSSWTDNTLWWWWIDREPCQFKKIVGLVSSIISSTAACTPNLRHCRKVWKIYGAGGLWEVSFIWLLHMFWSTHEALGEDFKDTWVRVDPNSPMPFISDITNE